MLIALLLGTLFPGISIAMTPGGTQIPNVGLLDFSRGSTNNTNNSNQTTVTVNYVPSVAINPSHSGYLQPGKSISYTHTVTNKGNVADTIDLTATSSLSLTSDFFASDGTTPLIDSDSDGKVDTGLLSPGASIDIVLKLTAPEELESGQVDQTSVTAASSINTSVIQRITDSSTVLKGKFWDPLSKSVEPSEQVTPDTILTYTNTFGNDETLAAKNVVITDKLDENLIYIEGSATEPEGLTGISIVYDPNSRTITWTIAEIPAGYVGKVSFKARINPDIPADTSIENYIRLTSNAPQTEQISNAVATVVVEQPLRISKSVNKTLAEIGDYVLYSVTVENTSKSMTANTVTINDRMPQGFRYLKKSTTLDNSTFNDPEGGTDLQWLIGSLDPGTSKTLSYRAIVSIDAPLGDGVNIASVTGKSPGGNNLSGGTARATVKVKEGVLNSKAIIMGRVFVDKNSATMPDDEPGIKGVRLYLEDGSYAITDDEGKFSVSGISAGEHVLKIDKSSFSAKYISVPLNNSFAGDGGSQFISVPFGGSARGDFALVPTKPDETEKKSEEPKPVNKEFVYTFGAELNSGPLPLEKQIQTMPDTPEILEPAAGASLKKNWSDIVIRVPDEAEYTLRVNGVPLLNKQIGKTIVETKKKIRICQYVGVKLDPGSNRIVLKTEKPDGNTEIKEIEVIVPGEPEKIIITPDRADIPADGKTVVPFTISLVDKWNKPSLGDHVITVLTNNGVIVDKDVDPSTHGHQLKIQNGKATFKLRSTLKTGDDQVKVLLGNVLEGKADVFFTPELRDWIIVGLGTLTVGNRSISGHVEDITQDDNFEKGIYHDERLAFFAKGKILGKYLLTAAYDSDKEKRDGLFQQVDPKKYYPIYGDASEIGYEAESQKKLFVKIERERSLVIVGDYHTNLTENEFSGYDRSFNGIKADINTNNLTLKAFESYTNHTLTKDEIPGNGTSGYYFLNKKPVIENSEKIRIEVRDRYHSERILSSVNMVRYQDYSIDYTAGTILFKEPVPSLDRDLNPVTIAVLYESEDPGDKFYIYGGRVSIGSDKGSEIGVTAIVEQKALKDSTVYGMDAKWILAERTTLRGETAWSDTLEGGKGEAWKLDLSSEILNKLKLDAYYRNIGRNFQNLSMTGSEVGTEKYGARASYKLSEKTDVAAESFVQNDKVSNSKLIGDSLGILYKFSPRISAEAGYRFIEEKDSTVPEKTAHIVFAGVSGNITDRLGASLRREQVITSSGVGNTTTEIPSAGQTFTAFTTPSINAYQTRTMLKVDYKLTATTKLFLTQEFYEGDANRRQATVIGMESKLTERVSLTSGYLLENGSAGSRGSKNMELNAKWIDRKDFTLSTKTAYSLENALSGERGQAILGLNTRYEVMKGLTVSATAERVQQVQGAGGNANGTAFTVGAEYLKSEDFKASGRYEIRVGQDQTTHLYALGSAFKFSKSLSLLGEVTYWDSNKSEGKDVLFDGSIGIAYRPLGKNSLYLLSVIRYKIDKKGSLPTNDDTRSMISSTEFTYRLNPRLLLSGKYAGKYSREKLNNCSFQSYTDMILGGFTFDITDRWDMGVFGKVMNQYQTKMFSTGGIIKVGYMVFKNLRVGIGYNFSKLNDRDLSGENYHSKGFFIEMKFKFDEDTFTFLSKNPTDKQIFDVTAPGTGTNLTGAVDREVAQDTGAPVLIDKKK